MAKERQSKSPRLKVYQTQLGFYESVVAAPNQSAALRAWGIHQNLFADGGAQVATEPGAIAAALAQPGVPLRRAPGSSEGFGTAPGLPRLPDLPRSPGRAKAQKPIAKPAPADRSPLDAAEAALAGLAEERGREERAFQQRRAALDEEEAAADRRYRDRKAQAEKALERERRAYTKAGGRLGPRG